MDSEVTPPKRITRARAAKATTSSATSGTAASAAKSKATNTTTAKTTKTSRAAATAQEPAASIRKSTKRKARDDDHDDESEPEAVTATQRAPPASRTAMRATRGPGRPKKTVDSDPAPAPTAAPRTRGRPAKKAATESSIEEAPAKATRTRTKKTLAGDVEGDDNEEDDPAPEPVKRPRGRPAGTATSASAPTSKPKKTVTFAEPDKENVVPITGARKRAVVTKPVEAPATSGMRAKPVRKPAGTGRAARTTATKKSTKETEAKKKQPMPLSPRKVSQLSANRDTDLESEDELAMDRAPARPFQRSPVKPIGTAKRPIKAQEEAAGEEDTAVLAPVEPTTLLGSPVRRPPQPTLEHSMRSPAKRIDGLQLGLPASQDTTSSIASPLKSSMLQSPAKRMPKKHFDLDPFSSSHDQTVNIVQSQKSPHKASLLQSPAKRMPIKPVDLDPFNSSREQTVASPFKQSLLQSPAKRGFSPFKPVAAPEPEEPTDRRSPAPTPVLLCSPPAAEENEETAAAGPVEVEEESEADDDEEAGSPSRTEFNGRMSTVLPRDVDPTLDHATSIVESEEDDDDCETVMLEEQSDHHVEIFEDDGQPMDVDEPEIQTEDVATGDVSTTPPNSPPRESLFMFGLREKDLIPFDTTYSESEDEITRDMAPNMESPTKSTRGSVKRARTSGLGFTPLARRFDEWQARSPLKPKTPKMQKSAETREGSSELKDSMNKGTFFDDEMCARQEQTANDSANDTDPLSTVPDIKDPVIEDISITEEDLDLAAEANEMSVMSPDQVESMLNLDSNDDSISDASQEYGDENEIPGQHTNGFSLPPVTPQRRMRREVHTVSKVPLKAADESTPPPQPSLRKRRHSVARVQVSRPTHQMARSATVISYSPSHAKQADAAFEEAAIEESHERSRSLSPPETPSKPEAWVDADTPGRTPRRDVNPTLLHGAVVFVDVHTVEGADASALFVELLTQMGARCVKTWNWNPNAEDAISKVGITHVLFKDGGKRTMEKVRETGGAVHCVGVGWVLE